MIVNKNRRVFLLIQTIKLDATNSFPSNTAEVGPIYLKMCHVMRKPVFVICEQQRRIQPAHPRSRIGAFVVLCLDSNEILQLKAIIYLDWHIHISNLLVCGKRLIVTCTGDSLYLKVQGTRQNTSSY